MSHSVVVGMGEVGSSLANILEHAGQKVFRKDIAEAEIPSGCGVLHLCLNYAALGKEKWLELARHYIALYKPALVDVCSTTPPGTTRLLGRIACHSTTRGLHPHLEAGLLNIAKHVGGPRAKDLAAYYAASGIRCMTHGSPDTTEAAHLAHLIDYGIQLITADWGQAFCRQANVDYIEAWTKYRDSHNSGFLALDMPSKVRMNLTPPGGRIGGHCIRQAAQIVLDAGYSFSRLQPLVELLARYNDEKK